MKTLQYKIKAEKIIEYATVIIGKLESDVLL